MTNEEKTFAKVFGTGALVVWFMALYLWADYCDRAVNNAVATYTLRDLSKSQKP